MELTKVSEVKLKDRIISLWLKAYPTVIKCILMFFISRLIIINGISPFSYPFLLATGNNFFMLLSSILGIISNIYINKYKYILLILFCYTVNIFLSLIFPNLKKEKSAPFIVFFSSLLFGMIFILFTDYVIYDILLVLLESFVSTVFYFVSLNSVWFFKVRNTKRHFTGEELSAPLIILCLLIAGTGNIPLPFGLAFKNIIGIYIILSVSLYANMGTTAQIAVFMAIAAGHGNEYFPLYISSFAITSLFCSVFAKYGKAASSLGFLIGNIIISVLLTESHYTVIAFQDISVAALLFLLTPESILGKLNSIFKGRIKETDNARAIKNIATVKLDRLSGAFRRLAETISEEKPENSSDKVSAAYDSVTDKICKICSMRYYCWQKDYELTSEAFIKITNVLKTKGTASTRDFPSYFIQKCIKADEVLSGLKNAYEISRINRVWHNRLSENTRIYKEQFRELSDIVNHLKNEIDKNPYFDKELSDEIISSLEKEGILIKTINILKDCNDSMEIDITLFPCNHSNPKCFEFISDKLEEVIGTPFKKSYGKCSFRECHLIFRENEIYDFTFSVRQISKNKGEKNGDSWAVNFLENGDKYIALCDGSGSGEEAGKYSSSTLSLLEEFLKTGFSKTSSVKLINSSFISANEQDRFSTIDLGIIDLKSGEFEILKKGAAPTYIFRADGEFDVIKSNTLPVGVFGGEKGKIKKTILFPGDIVIMASDGVSDALSKEDWIIDALSAINSDDTEHIAETIMKIAVTAEADDDKTVIVGKFKKTG